MSRSTAILIIVVVTLASMGIFIYQTTVKFAPERENEEATNNVDQINRPSVPEASLDDLRKFVADGQSLIIDVRDPVSFAFGHVPRAKNISSTDLFLEITEAQKDTSLIVYCENVECAIDDEAVLSLLEEGFINAKAFQGGWQEWQAASLGSEYGGGFIDETDIVHPTLISAADLKSRLESGESISVIDLRTEEEYLSGHIEGARSMPTSDADAISSVLSRDSAVVLYGSGSQDVAEELIGKGLLNILVLESGYQAWLSLE